MKQNKKGSYSEKEDKALLDIPYVSGRGPHTNQLRTLAAKWNRSYDAVWQRWYQLHGKGSNAIITTSPSTNKSRQKAILPMTFKAVEFDSKNFRMDPDEIIAMEKGLEEAIIGPLSTPKRAILFPKRMVNRAKEYLKKKHPRHVFSFHTNAGDKRFMLLTKKV